MSTVRGRRSGTRTRVTPKSQPAEHAQAIEFKKALRRELSAMKSEAALAEALWKSRCEAEGLSDPPERLVVIRGCITDVRRMINALNRRYKADVDQ
jgi:hypothetical protein